MPIAKNSGSVTTAIVLPAEQLELVRRAALSRALISGACRISASDVIRAALTAYEPTLREDAAKFPNLPISPDMIG